MFRIFTLILVSTLSTLVAHVSYAQNTSGIELKDLKGDVLLSPNEPQVVNAQIAQATDPFSLRFICYRSGEGSSSLHLRWWRRDDPSAGENSFRENPGFQIADFRPGYPWNSALEACGSIAGNFNERYVPGTQINVVAFDNRYAICIVRVVNNVQTCRSRNSVLATFNYESDALAALRIIQDRLTEVRTYIEFAYPEGS